MADNLAPIDSDLDIPTKAYVDARAANEVSIQNDQPVDGSELWVDWDDNPTPVQTTTPGVNRIVNGDFSVNQRGFAGPTSTQGVTLRGHDCWAAAGNGGTITYAAVAAALGELPESARSFARIACSGQSGTSAYQMLLTKIEGVRTLSGKMVTVSFWAKAASGTPKIAVELQQNYGTGGSGIDSTPAGAVTIGTTWTRYSLSVFVPAATGKTIGTSDSLGVLLWVSSGPDYAPRASNIGIQSNTFDIWGVQIEEGTAATGFDQRSYGDQLRACQRYLTVITGPTTAILSPYGPAPATTQAYIPVQMPVPMRVIPALSTVGSFYLSDRAANWNVSNFAVFQSATPLHVDLQITTSTAMTAGKMYAIIAASSPSTLIFSAEIP